MADHPQVFRCDLDHDQCLTLEQILRSFQTAINEEQAWALCFQIVKCCRQHYHEPVSSSSSSSTSSHQTANTCYLITDPAHVHIHKDGYVHPKTLHQKTIKDQCRTPAKNSHRLLTSLGIVLFHALDYGLCDDEERTLSKPLELLIERLTTAQELATVSGGRRGGGTTGGGHRRSKHHHHHRARNGNGGVVDHPMNSMGSDDYVDDCCDDECCCDDIEVDIADDDDEEIHLQDDEGIERDCGTSGGQRLINFDQIMQMCVSRLSSRESADNHYKAVCRALVAETRELSTFLDQIAKGTKELQKCSGTGTVSSTTSSTVTASGHGGGDNSSSSSSLDRLEFHDWARLWIQVIRELRHGVKLKKVHENDRLLDDLHQTNNEYELTPYEMLLDDIRSRRYKLNKVMINGDLPPRIKKDAHELILDFIRSRPPLVPVSQRILKPAPPRQVTMYEKLMESIRKHEHTQLRPTPTPRGIRHQYSFSAYTTPVHHHQQQLETLEENQQQQQQQRRSVTPIGETERSNKRKKLIKANIELNLDLDVDDFVPRHEESIQIEIPTASGRCRPMSAYYPSDFELDRVQFELNQENTRPPSADSHTTDKSSQESSKTSIFQLRKLSSHFFFSGKDRRHSISVSDLQSLHEQQEKASAKAEADLIDDLDLNEDAREHVAAIWEKSDFGKSLECLSLTLKEVQHIRSVLTKAEIESLGVTRSLKKDLENGKICFTCLKTKFTFWGPWATICKLCNRAICDRCSTKMHIPVEQFDRVPIYMLSPTSSPPNERHVHDIFKSAGGGTGESTRESKSLPPKLLPTTEGNTAKNRMLKIVRMLTLNDHDQQSNGRGRNPSSSSSDDDNHLNHHHHRGGGPLVKVCRDCKILVRHLIDMGHTNFVGRQKKYSENENGNATTTTTTTGGGIHAAVATVQ